MLKVTVMGWTHKNLDQTSRIKEGFLQNDCILTDQCPDFIYVHDGSQYDAAIEFHQFCKSKNWPTRLLMKVLDLPVHLRSDFSVEKEKLLKADLVLTNSKFVQKQVKEILGLESIVVYDAIKEIKHLPHIQKTFDFLMVGRVADSNKRAHLAQQLLSLPGNEKRKLVGCGSEVFPFSGDNIYNMGILDDVGLETLGNNAKFVLALGKVEGLSLVPHEFLGCSIPIVCSDMTAGFPYKEFVCDPDPISINNKILEIEKKYQWYREVASSYHEVSYARLNKYQIAKNIINAFESIK